MLEVVLIGANSQVAAEVAIHLLAEPDVRVVGLVRSPYSAALLRLLDVPWAAIDYNNPDDLRRVLAQAHLAVDFTYPSVQLPDILPAIRRTTSAIISALPPGCRYVLASSIMAFGTPTAGRLRHHALPHSSYAHIKRMAERITQDLGRAHGVQTIRLRLGQVHGELQAVTQEYIELLSGSHLVVEGVQSDLSSTVFISSVATALSRIARGSVAEGLYTLVSSPQWTLGQLFDYYRNRYQTPATVSYRPAIRQGGSAFRSAFGTSRARALAEIGLFLRYPQLFIRAKGAYRIRSVASSGGSASPAGPVLRHLVGLVPGLTLPHINSEPASVLEAQQRAAERFAHALEHGRREYQVNL